MTNLPLTRACFRRSLRGALITSSQRPFFNRSQGNSFEQAPRGSLACQVQVGLSFGRAGPRRSRYLRFFPPRVLWNSRGISWSVISTDITGYLSPRPLLCMPTKPSPSRTPAKYARRSLMFFSVAASLPTPTALYVVFFSTFARDGVRYPSANEDPWGPAGGKGTLVPHRGRPAVRGYRRAIGAVVRLRAE